MNKKLASEYVEHLCRNGILERRGELLAPAGYEIRKDEIFCGVRTKVLAALNDAGYQFAKISGMEFSRREEEHLEELLLLLSENGEIVKLSDDCYTLPSHLEKACTVIRDRFRGKDRITVAEVRDLFGTSRKNVRMILDYTDRIGMTQKTGGESERALLTR